MSPIAIIRTTLAALLLPIGAAHAGGATPPEWPCLAHQAPRCTAPSIQAADLLGQIEPSAGGQQVPDPAASSDATAEGNLLAESQNPIANLVSVPLQSNTNFGVGPFGRTQEIFNIQPVIPVSLSRDWLLVSRIIVPLIYQPELSAGVGNVFGLGDINPTFFFVPKNTGALTYGFGPALLFPTASDRSLGAGKWGAGPGAVLVYTSGSIVAGALVNQVWSFAGDAGRPDLSQFLIQPFLNYNLPGGWFVVTSPIVTANWLGGAGNQWTVPVGGGGGKLLTLGRRPVSISLQFYWNAVRPEGAADWTVRFVFTLLFPQKT
ncbi:MAG: neuromedin U [Aphanocapsa lilacina HA4352-LM1]|jgi:hypothetical protein|nr:neuromedin U [Aphanocapsa lilacina HA4352-LM1]